MTRMQILNILSRYSLVLFGLANWLFGSIVLVYVMWTLNTTNNFHLLTSGKGLVTSSQLIFGLIVSIKGLLAVFGALRKQSFLMKWSELMLFPKFLFLSIMIISLEIGTFISIKVTNIKISDLIVQSWQETNLSTRNYVQRELKCCGLTGLSEFASKLDPIDESCYIDRLDAQNREPYRVGCKEKLIEWLSKRKREIIGVMTAMLVSQIVIVILGLMQLKYLLNPSTFKRSNSIFQGHLLLPQRVN